MASEPLTKDELHETNVAAWVLILAGLVSVAVGVIVLVKPEDSLVTLVIIAGIFILVDGSFDLVASLTGRRENAGVAAVLSVLSIVIGVLLIRHPIGGVLAAALLIGIWLIASGVLRVIRAFQAPRPVWGIVAGLLVAAAGIVLVSSPKISYATLALLVGISFIVNGVARFALGLVVHGLRHTERSEFGAGAPA
jgi:uncharacterized membrane protein HdeD (DUF308 family)